MTNTLAVRTMSEVVTDIFERLGALQNVLYDKSAPQDGLQQVWADVQIIAAALKEADEMVAVAMLMNIETEKQRDAAIKAMVANRAQLIAFAETQERRVIAAGVALDKEDIDESAILAALEYIAGARKGDASERAQWDVARALERLGQELNQQGV